MNVQPGLRPTRRQVLRAAAAGGAGLAGARLLPPSLLRALAAPAPTCASLSDIENVVILVQENRSFDHYFGRYPGVRGFDDTTVNRSIFAQRSSATDASQTLLPFHIDTALKTPPGPGECTNDIDHQWATQHRVWNGGACDRWVLEHIAVNGPQKGLLTMGYYDRPDLEFHWALADQFTLCDNFHCSTIGGTDINRLYTMTGTLDPDGFDGGVQFLDTRVSDRYKYLGSFGKNGRWTTYPEQLQAKGVSWKVYGTVDGHYGDNVLAYFKAYTDPTSPLFQNAFGSQNPGPYLADFTADCLAGTLPQVSWIIAGLADTEHAPAPVEWGQDFVYHVLEALTANPAQWAKTLLFITYDENGGFFDHVPPPTSPAQTPGEYIPHVAAGSAAYTESGGGQFLDPIGLGFRVPLLVVSPFTRGGLVCSDLFDHTSLLRFLETRFGAEIPMRDATTQRAGLSAWRRALVGDLTTTLNLAAPPDTSVPVFSSAQTPNRADPRVLDECAANPEPIDLAPSPLGDQSQPYPVPAQQSMPTQYPASGPVKRPSGPVACGTAAVASAASPSGGTAGLRTAALATLPLTEAVSPGAAAEVLAGAVVAGVAWVAHRRRMAVEEPG